MCIPPNENNTEKYFLKKNLKKDFNLPELKYGYVSRLYVSY